MGKGITWSVVLACPSEAELPLLADLSARRNARIAAVADPAGTSVGAELAEIMGIPVVASLSALESPGDLVLVYGSLSAAVLGLMDEAAALGITAMRATAFEAQLRGPAPGVVRVTASPPPAPDAGLESEAAAIHRTLSRIEEALDRESLLRWVLGLAMRAVGAGSGSIMLLDDATDELYVAFAHGLSDATLHGTRVRPGEGIAGRVLATGRAERIEKGGDPRRDRGAIIDAVCVPVVRGGRVLGVINLSATIDDGPLAADALARAGALSHRVGELLERFLRLQAVCDRDRLRTLDEDLGLDTLDAVDPLDLLRGWTGRLAAAVGAEAVSIGLLTADGDLCVINGDITHQSPPDHDLALALTTGQPVVQRDLDHGETRTVIHLPLGRDPARVVLSVGFASAGPAHRFRAGAGDFLYVVRRHLGHVVDQAARLDEIHRLTALASALSSLAETADDATTRDRVLAAARRLTGARRSYIVEQDPAPGEEPLLAEARNLLQTAGEQGWVASTLAGRRAGDEPEGVLVVPLDTTRPLPGLVLAGKTRVHPLDAAAFTETDARFARRLLPLLRAPRPAAAPPAAPASAQGAAPATKAKTAAAGGGGTDGLLTHLRRELDRCDRYHTMIGLAAFRLPSDAAGPSAVGALAGQLRSSDMVGCLDDGTIVVIVPEEVQSLSRLQRRVEDLLRTITGAAGLVVRSAAAVYPGPADDAAALLGSLTRSLA